MKRMVLVPFFVGCAMAISAVSGQGVSDDTHKMSGMVDQKVSEQQIINRLDTSDKQVFQQLSAEEKALVLKIVNQSKDKVDKVDKVDRSTQMQRGTSVNSATDTRASEVK